MYTTTDWNLNYFFQSYWQDILIKKNFLESNSLTQILLLLRHMDGTYWQVRKDETVRQYYEIIM